MTGLLSQFAGQVARAPEQIAIDGAFTYRQLDAASDAQARALMAQGVRPGDVVALRMQRTAGLVVAILAVLKAQAAYLPLGVAQPSARLAGLLSQADARFVLSDDGLPPLPDGAWSELGHLPDSPDTALPGPDPERPACLFHTSGTTGQPKLMRIGQPGILRMAENPDYVTVTSQSRIALLANPAFDALNFEIWAALLNGAMLVPFEADAGLDPDLLAQRLRETSVTGAFFTTSLFHLLAELRPESLLALEWVVIGGEAASAAHVHRLFAARPDSGLVLVNGYGPTECTTFAVAHQMTAAGWVSPDHPQTVPIGLPLRDTPVQIVDPDTLDPVLPGEWGELLIGGSGLSEGYLGRHEDTAAKFITLDGQRFYRSGDLARWQQGVLECGGRLDQQVKVRGHRVELAEIETHLMADPRIGQAAVVFRDRRLCAFVVAAPGLTAGELRRDLGRTLPGYMLPQDFVFLARLPLTANGKLDRQALVLSERRLWEGELPPGQSLLELGGDSLTAARLVTEWRARGLRISLGDLLSDRPLADVLDAAQTLPAETVSPCMNPPATSYAAASEQYRLWLAQAMQPASTAYSIPLRFDFDSTPDEPSLERALTELVVRHPVLRACFEETDEGLTVRIAPPCKIVLEHPVNEAAFFADAFDLGAGLLLRAGVIGQRLLLNLHHIVVDGAALNILLADLAALYTGQSLPPAQDYAGYPAWQAAQFGSPGYQSRRQDRLAALGAPPDRVGEVMHLPAPMSGRLRQFLLPLPVLTALQDLARRRGQSLFSLLIGIHATTLWRMGHGTRLSIGLPVGLRPEGYENVVGMFVNTQILRLDLDPAAGTDALLDRVDAGVRALRAAHDVSYDHMIADLRAAGQHGAAFETMFVLENTEYRLPGLAARFVFPVEVDPRFPLTLFATATGEGLACQIEHDTALFDAAAADRFENLFIQTVHAMANGVTELAQLARPPGIVTLINRAIAQWPERPAAICGAEKLSFAGLDRAALALAAALHQQGARSGDRIGLSLPPGVSMLVGLLAILRLGAAYVPLDPEYPPLRREFIIRDAGLRLVVAMSEEGMPAGIVVVRPDVDCDAAAPLPDAAVPAPDSLAYVIYTSGSTGQPKGVCVNHGSLANYIDHAATGYFAPYPLQGGVVSTSLNFDATVTSLLGPLCQGLPAILLPATDLAAMTELALGEVPLLFKLTPSHLVALLSYAVGRQGPAGHILVIGGEQLATHLVQDVLALLPNARIVNEYGPTEATVGCITAWAGRSDGPAEWRGAMVIGRPIAGAEILLLDAEGQQAEPGQEGEIVIGGACVAQGYLNQPALTASRFVMHGGQRVYRTGDRAIRLPTGDIAYLGRSDDQLKLNGYRIEPGEVEAVLGAVAGVQAAAVLQHGGQLLGFFTGTATPGEIQPQLAAALPAHMRPARLIAVASMPLTPNGKLDKAALIAGQRAATTGTPVDAEASVPAPTPGSILRLAALFEQVLGHAIGPEQQFFDAGAGSLALMKVHALARRDLAPGLALVDFFRHPTLVQLAAHIDTLHPAAPVAASGPAVPAPAPSGTASADPGRELARGIAADIAVVGMAVGLPGAEDLATLWQMIAEGRSAIRLALSRGEGHVNAVSSIARPLGFDPGAFGIPPREAGLMDPQQRHLLMGAVQALDHAGLDPAALRIGLIAASSENSYHQMLLRHGEDELSAYGLALLHEKDFLASRIAHLLNLRGPALTVQTACSSSLVAVHQACQALRAGEAEAMIAGGCNISLAALEGYQHQPGHIFSADGRCAPFSAAASGTVPANGWGLVVLRPLAAAQAAGDRILAVIKGSAVNNDGNNKVGFTAPSAAGQTEVIQTAMARAGISAGQIGYVEAHGTATALGDPIEADALGRAYGPEPQGAIAIGSIKSQIGHMGAGAGIAGLIRTVLSLWHRTLPPTLGFDAPSPGIAFEQLPLRVQTNAAPWPKDRPLAGVSSFGMGGTNAHVVLAPPPVPPQSAPAHGPQVLLLHGRSAALVEAQAQALAHRLQSGTDLPGLAAATQRAARNTGWRAAVVCTTAEEATALLYSLHPTRPELQAMAEPKGARAIAEAWLAGLPAGALPRPAVPAAWDLPPTAFDLSDHVHPAAQPDLQPPLPDTSRRLPRAEWFRVPVWQRGTFSGQLEEQPSQVIDLDENWPATLLPLLRESGAGLARSGQSLTLRVRPDAAGSLSADLAMLSGFLRAAAAELPGLGLRLIAADRDALLPAHHGPGFVQQLLQNGRMWQAATSEAARPAGTAIAIRPGRYLITGGSGGMAQSLARCILKEPGTEVILASRSGHAMAGATGVVLDIADMAAVEAFAFSLKGQGLVGVIHAAGVPGGGAVQLMQPDMLDATLSPKRDGTIGILRHLAPLTEDFILLCSSLSAVVGVAGQADYAAANAWLDACAEDWTVPSGPRVMSVNWPAWRGIGMSGRLAKGSGKMTDLARTLDAGALSEAEGWEVFHHALRLGLPRLIVSPLPLDSLQPAPAVPSDVPVQPGGVAAVVARFLGVEDIDPLASFYDLGGDSLLGLDVLDALAQQGHDLPASLLSGPFSVTAIEAAILATTGPQARAAPLAEPVPVTLRSGTGDPVVLIHPIGGDVVSYRMLAAQIAPGRPVLAIEDPVLSDPAAPELDIDSRARAYLAMLKGPVSLAGWSFGGLVAFAMARIAPERIVDLALIDPPAPHMAGPVDPAGAEAAFLAEITHRKQLGLVPGDALRTNPYLARLLLAFSRNSRAMADWQAGPMPAIAPPSSLILAEGQGAVAERAAAWLKLMPHARVLRLPGDHFSILQPPELGALTDALNRFQPETEGSR